MRLIFSIIFGLAVLFRVSTASALAIISMDLDPSIVGIQSTLTVDPGDTFGVDVVVEGIGTVSPVGPLQSFEFDVDFDSNILSAISVVDGGFLTAPVFVFESDIIAPDVNFDEVTFGLSTASGSGVLASITFDAIAAGTSILDLNDVILKLPFPPGGNIPVSISDGTLTVTPEPTTMLLLGTGLAGLAVWQRRRFKGCKTLFRAKGNT